MNRKNLRYICPLAAAVTLDSTQKQCSEHRTDGEELKNRSLDPRRVHSIVALFLCAIKGRSLRDDWFLPQARNLRTDLRGFLLPPLDLQLTQMDQHLPFPRHVFCFVKQLYAV